MSLIDKLYDGEINQDVFSAGLWFWAKGDITRQNVIDGLGLDVSDEVQLDLLAANYLARSTEDRQIFFSDLEAAILLARNALITKSKFLDLLGL